MAISNITGELLTITAKINYLNDHILNLQSQKSLSLYSQQDLASLKLSEISEAKRYFKDLWQGDTDLQEDYTSYTEIPDFEEQIDIITAKYQEKMEELTAWETIIDQDITTSSGTLEEAKVWRDSYKTMLTSNIQSDFAFGLDQ